MKLKKKIIDSKISSIACIVTLILLFLFLGQPNIHAATCSDRSGTIVISSNCEDFVSNGSIDSLTINSGVTVDKSGTHRAMYLNHTIGTITINGTVADDIRFNHNTVTTINIGAGATVTDDDVAYTIYMGNSTNITNFTNAGTISSTGQETIYNQNTDANFTNITNFTNTGTISAATHFAINGGTFGTLTNQGTISAGGGHGISLGDVTTFTNSGTISDADTTAVYVDDGHTVGNFENSGTLTSTNGDGILTHANATFTNLTITSASTFNVGTGQYDIDNQGAITTLNNGESQISLNKNLPSNYNIIVGSTTVFGTLDVSNVAGTTTFGIDSSSSLSSGTYTNVITGVSVSNFSGGVAPSGTYGGCTWSLTTDGSNNWSLVVSCNTNPSLSSSSPSDNATDVALDANIVLNFSEIVDVESGNITIKKTSNNSTVETIDVTSSQVTGTGTSQITINPSSNFETGIEYYVLIDATAFDDTESGSYAGISSTTALSFTSVTNVLPTLNSSTPADNATSVAVNANIVLNFSEIVDVETGNITIKKTTDDSTFETIDVTGSKVTGTGTTQITVNPSSDFDYGTEYYVLIDATAFDDVLSGSYAGISSKTALSFTSVTNVLPTLSSSTPADDATSVERDANIVLNFSEIVDVETGNITIKKTTDDSTFETIDVTSSQVTGTGTTQITINPTSNFDAEIEYYVLIDATAFDDVSSGSYTGISSTTALSFTTESMTDPITDKDVVGSIDVQSQLAKNIVTQSTSTVLSRLSYLRRNKGNQNLSKKNIKFDFGNAILTSLANELLAKNDKPIIPDNWSSWSEGSISVSKIGDRLDSSSSETDAQAFAFGFDTKLKDNDLLGFAIQYGQSDTNIGSSGSTTDSENINLSVYRTKPLDDDNFIEGIFGVGLIESDLFRVSGSNTLTGSRNGTQIFGSVNYDKTIYKGDFNLTPIARVDLGYTELDAYSETGTDALSYAKQTIESGLASVGVEYSDILKFKENRLKPFGKIEYGLDFSNSSNAKMNYVSDTSTIYTYTKGTNSNHLITSVVGFEYITKDNLEIISSYKRIQGNDSEQTDILNVLVNFKSKRETEFAMSLDGSEDLAAGFDISKNIDGIDLNFNAKQSFNENGDQKANVSLSRKF